MPPTADVLTTKALFPEQTASKISSGLILQFPWLTSLTGLGETCLRFLWPRLGCCTEAAWDVELKLEGVSTLAAALRLGLLGGFNKPEREEEEGLKLGIQLEKMFSTQLEAAVKGKTRITVKTK